MSKLNLRQQRFAEEYCVDFNATQAALRAGYSPKTAYSQGQRLLKHVEVSAFIQKRVDDLSMSSKEALIRLTNWGRGDVGPFLNADDNGQVCINLGSELAKDNYHLLRKVKQVRTVTRGENDYEREEIRTEFELHDAKDAVKEIAKIRKLYGNSENNQTSGMDEFLELTEFDDVEETEG